ncbi:MAG: hypothetical protein Q8Q94_02020 [bacterium]|nr:hypothetical protein [bacterium]MDZ4299710.1 hypothetical protein [Candidatus Sungbacteria bacterium]
MIAKGYRKVKEVFEEHRSDFFIAAIIFLTALASFGLGRLSVIWPRSDPLTISDLPSRDSSSPAIQAAVDIPPLKNNPDNTTTVRGVAQSVAGEGRYVASKSGTRYHFSWCPSALKIKKENKLIFATAAEARAKGYTPAANCPGLD